MLQYRTGVGCEVWKMFECCNDRGSLFFFCSPHQHVYTHIFHSVHKTELVFTLTPSNSPWLLCTSPRPHEAWCLRHLRSERLSSAGRSVKGLISQSKICLRRFGTRWQCPSHSGAAATKMSSGWPFQQRVSHVRDKRNQWSIKRKIGVNIYQSSPADYYLAKMIRAPPCVSWQDSSWSWLFSNKPARPSQNSCT